MRKTQVNIEEMHIISCTCVSLTRRAHKLDEMGTTSKMHPRIKTRAHLSVDQRKAGLGECQLGSADPLVGQIRPIFLLQSPTDPLHLSRACIVPPRESNHGSTFGEAT